MSNWCRFSIWLFSRRCEEMDILAHFDLKRKDFQVCVVDSTVTWEIFKSETVFSDLQINVFKLWCWVFSSISFASIDSMWFLVFCYISILKHKKVSFVYWTIPAFQRLGFIPSAPMWGGGNMGRKGLFQFTLPDHNFWIIEGSQPMNSNRKWSRSCGGTMIPD